MRVKPGVDFDGIQPALLRGLAVADEVYRRVTGADVIVTSVMRNGPKNLLHRVGLAADLAVRTWDYKLFDDALIDKVLDELSWVLDKDHGGEFDVVDERKVTTGAHIHIEHDPLPRR